MSRHDGSAGGLRSRDSVRGLTRPAFELSGFGRAGAGADFAEHDKILADLASRALEPRRASDGGLLAGLNLDLPDVPTMNVFGDDEELLADARRCIADAEYSIASDLLDEYLQGSPAHQEARFLLAFCLYHLGEARFEDALRSLRPLRDEPMPTQLQDQVQELRRELRRLLAPGEYEAYAATAKKDPKAALARVGAFLELAPEEGRLAYLLALGHARLGEFEKALDAAERGAAEADTDRRQIAQLSRRLRVIVLQTIADPAAAAYKTRDPHRARALLARMDARWRESEPIRDFDRYLALVIEHGNPSVPPEPLLANERAEDLYSLIAERDVQRALGLMTRGGIEQAERLLDRLMAAVPRFALLNFVYAACLYRLGRRPDRAEACARAALRDPTLGQARDLLAAIHGWQEAVAVNPVVEEFLAITDTLRGRVSPRQLPVLRTRLAELERTLPGLRAAMRTADGQRALQELHAAISAWQTEIGKAEVVNALYDEYERIMTTAKGGLRDLRQADQLAASLDALGPRIAAARTAAGGTLDELATQVRARRAEIDKARTSIQVADLVRRFNDVSKLLAGGTGIEPAAYRAVGDYARPIGQEALRLRNSAGRTLDERDRQVLDQLIATIGRLWP